MQLSFRQSSCHTNTPTPCLPFSAGITKLLPCFCVCLVMGARWAGVCVRLRSQTYIIECLKKAGLAGKQGGREVGWQAALAATTRLGLKKRLPSNILARPRPHTHSLHTSCHPLAPSPPENGTQTECIALGRQGMLQLCSLHTFQQFMLVCECLRVESPSRPPFATTLDTCKWAGQSRAGQAAIITATTAATTVEEASEIVA